MKENCLYKPLEMHPIVLPEDFFRTTVTSHSHTTTYTKYLGSDA